MIAQKRIKTTKAMIAQKIVKTTEAIDLDIKGITLLSIEEYKACKEHIKHTSPSWWLRSPGLNCLRAAVVFSFGDIYNSGDFIYVPFGVRPVLEINLKTSNLQIGDEIELMNCRWTVISNKLILCNEIIAKRPFRKDWRTDNANDYNKSDIKQWLEDWFTEKVKG